MLVQAIDWAIAQDAKPGNPLNGHVATDKVAAMGHSCGGVQAAWAALHDTRIRTLIFGNSGLLDPPLKGIEAMPADLAKLSIPVAFIIGGPSDIAYPGAQDNFPRLDKGPVLKANLNVGHGGTYSDPHGGEYAPVVISWLDAWLKDSAEARKTFAGPNCEICRKPEWDVQARALN